MNKMKIFDADYNKASGTPKGSIERREKPLDPVERPREDGGPKKPDTDSPEKENLLKRMRKVDPKQAERYRQRTGQ